MQSGSKDCLVLSADEDSDDGSVVLKPKQFWLKVKMDRFFGESDDKSSDDNPMKLGLKIAEQDEEINSLRKTINDMMDTIEANIEKNRINLEIIKVLTTKVSVMDDLLSTETLSEDKEEMDMIKVIDNKLWDLEGERKKWELMTEDRQRCKEREELLMKKKPLSQQKALEFEKRRVEASAEEDNRSSTRNSKTKLDQIDAILWRQPSDDKLRQLEDNTLRWLLDDKNYRESDTRTIKLVNRIKSLESENQMLEYKIMVWMQYFTEAEDNKKQLESVNKALTDRIILLENNCRQLINDNMVLNDEILKNKYTHLKQVKDFRKELDDLEQSMSNLGDNEREDEEVIRSENQNLYNECQQLSYNINRKQEEWINYGKDKSFGVKSYSNPYMSCALNHSNTSTSLVNSKTPLNTDLFLNWCEICKQMIMCSVNGDQMLRHWRSVHGLQMCPICNLSLN